MVRVPTYLKSLQSSIICRKILSAFKPYFLDWVWRGSFCGGVETLAELVGYCDSEGAQETVRLLPLERLSFSGFSIQ